MNQKKNFKYGKPLSSKEAPKPRKRLPEYDEALREFLNSGADYWMIDIKALPSKDPMVVLSSIRWRIKNKPDQLGNIRVFMRKSNIYLQKVKDDK
jgi:hypothetical protein